MNILFVDDDKSILRSIGRIMFDIEEDWDVDFANSGMEALEMLEEDQYDMIISDMRMPEMNGAELLEIVKEKYPSIIRFILSGYSDRELTLKTVQTAEQFLSKPCSAENLIGTIKDAFMANEIITEESVRQVISEFKILPTSPKIYTQLCEYLEGEDIKIEEVAKIVSQDVVIMTKLLRLVNSAFFGLRRRVESVEDAVKYLGFDILKALVLSTEVFNQFCNNKIAEEEINRLNYEATRISLLAKKIMMSINGDKALQNKAYLVGIISNVGKVIFVENNYKKYLELETLLGNKKLDEYEAEREMFGITHCEIGAFLICKWGFDKDIVQSVKSSQSIESILEEDLKAEGAVYIANYLVKRNLEDLEEVTRVKQFLVEKYQINEKLSDYIQEWCKLTREVLVDE